MKCHGFRDAPGACTQELASLDFNDEGRGKWIPWNRGDPLAVDRARIAGSRSQRHGFSSLSHSEILLLLLGHLLPPPAPIRGPQPYGSIIRELWHKFSLPCFDHKNPHFVKKIISNFGMGWMPRVPAPPARRPQAAASNFLGVGIDLCARHSACGRLTPPGPVAIPVSVLNDTASPRGTRRHRARGGVVQFERHAHR